MTLDKLIKILQEIKKEVGNVPVVLSSDSEGNSFGTLNAPLSFCKLQDDYSSGCEYPISRLSDVGKRVNEYLENNKEYL